MAFAGMSLVTAEGKLCTSTVSPIDCRAVEGFSRTRDNPPTGEYIRSRTFLVGGRRWYLKYYPNGLDSECVGFVSVLLGLEVDDEEDEDGDGEQARTVKAQSAICFIDQFQWYCSVFIHEKKINDFRDNPVGCAREFMKRRDLLERSAHLKDDSFIIRIDVIVLDIKVDISTEVCASTMTPSLIQVPPSRHFKDLLLTKEGADVTFEIGGKMFAAHRCVLAARSTVFKSQLVGGILEGATVKIDGIEAHVFKDMLAFIYTDTLPLWTTAEEESNEMDAAEEETEETDSEVEEEVGDVSFHYITWVLQLLEAANRYDLHRLKSMCQEKLTLSIELSNVVDIIVLAEQRGSSWSKEVCLEFIKTYTSLHKDFTA